MLLALTSILFGFKEQNSLNVSLDQLFADVENKMASVSTLQFDLKRTERINGELISVENYIRYQANPFKSCIQFLGDKEGDYLLYSPSENEGKAIYIPGGFPYINVNLDPESYLMRRTSHYTVAEIGVKFIVDQIKGNYIKWKNNFYYRGVIDRNGRSFHVIEGVLDSLDYFNYQVKNGETISELGKRYFVSEYMLIEINENIDGFDDDLEIGRAHV